MSRNIKLLLLVLVIGLGSIGCSDSESEQNAEETIICPVMPDKTILRKYFVDYDGKRVYLCCEACVRLFKKQPERYMKKVQQLGIVLENVPSDVAN